MLCGHCKGLDKRDISLPGLIVVPWEAAIPLEWGWKYARWLF